mmetsp:Transcript_52499/g.145902  ORF Transcript_52499/g.145902 Transcript_52499/m.145902 type:complete len:227 (-) Transcript_52499:483-1163(-)
MVDRVAARLVVEEDAVRVVRPLVELAVAHYVLDAVIPDHRVDHVGGAVRRDHANTAKRVGLLARVVHLVELDHVRVRLALALGLEVAHVDAPARNVRDEVVPHPNVRRRGEHDAAGRTVDQADVPDVVVRHLGARHLGGRVADQHDGRLPEPEEAVLLDHQVRRRVRRHQPGTAEVAERAATDHSIDAAADPQRAVVGEARVLGPLIEPFLEAVAPVGRVGEPEVF